MAQRPANTRIDQVINFGVDKRIPLGIVDTVIDKKTGNILGYMKNGKFYNLNTDAADVERAQTESVKNAEIVREKRAAAEAEANPFGTVIKQYGLAITTGGDGKTFVGGSDGNEYFLYATADPTKPGSTVLTPTRDYDVVRKAILADANKTPGGMDDLFNRLYSAGAITKETFNKKDIATQDFNAGLQYAVRNYTLNAMYKQELGGIKEAPTFGSYLAGDFRGTGTGSKAGTRTSQDMVITKRSDAADDADEFFMKYLGRGATKDEEDAYYDALNKAEKNAIRSTKTQYDADGRPIKSTQTGELLDLTDKNLILGKIAGSAIKGTPLAKVLELGGTAAGDVQSIMAYAKSYGVKLTEDDAMKYVTDNISTGKTLDNTKAKILALSKATYGNIKDLITNDVSVREIAGNFAYQKAQTLELNMDAIDVFDKDIQDALVNENKGGVMSLTDFNRKLRNDPRWAQTKNAREEASNYAYDILKSFGLMA